MKHKVGDKVRIKSKEWYEENKNAEEYVNVLNERFIASMADYCGKIATITSISTDSIFYRINLDNGCWKWNDGMFEDDEPQVSETLLKDIANVIKAHNMGVQVSEEDGKLIIEPLTTKEDLAVDTPVLVSDDDINFTLRYYAGNGEVFCAGQHDAETEGTCRYLTTIPWDKFNPKDISESLKHNIVKS